MKNDDDTRITIYVCPAPDCKYAAGTVESMTDHINDVHHGEWNGDGWPGPEGDDG